MAKAGKKALIKVSGAAVGMVAEACGTSDTITYQVTNAAKRVLSRVGTVTVKDGGVATAESYTLNRLTGQITFGGAAVRVITVDADYLPMATAAEAHEYSYTLAKDAPQVPYFGDNYQRRIHGTRDISGSLSMWHTITDYIEMLTDSGDEPVLLEFYSDSTSAFDVRCWALLNSDEVKSAVAGAVTESVSFEGTTDADGRSISG